MNFISIFLKRKREGSLEGAPRDEVSAIQVRVLVEHLGLRALPTMGVDLSGARPELLLRSGGQGGGGCSSLFSGLIHLPVCSRQTCGLRGEGNGAWNSGLSGEACESLSLIQQ